MNITGKDIQVCTCIGLDIFDECTCAVNKSDDPDWWARKRVAKILKFMLRTNIMSYVEYCKLYNLSTAHSEQGENLTCYCHELLLIYERIEDATRRGHMDVEIFRFDP